MAELPTFKKFVSEDDIAEAKKKRQEEWEKVRQPHQPEEAPEEEYDPRSLFERLEANRVKKQEEFDESHRLKNMIRGLENDEIEFLETVSKFREQEEQDKVIEEQMLLAEYKSSLVYDRTATQDEEIQTAAKKQTSKPSPQKHAKSQKTLLAGVIKKKRVSETDEVAAKKSKIENENKLQSSMATSSETASDAKTNLEDNGTIGQTTTNCSTETPTSAKPATGLGALAGLGNYSDSESSDEN